MSLLPLCDLYDPQGAIAWWRGRTVSRQQFLAQVLNQTRTLPARAYAINLCHDRYLFMAAFAGVVAGGGTNLLPPHRSSQVLREIAADYPDSYCLTDRPLPELDLPQHLIDPLDESPGPLTLPRIPADHPAAIVFTSGSTGQARPNPKRWGDLHTGSRLARQRFELGPSTSLVATVPPQHMYGLETSVLQALFSGVCVHGERPFFAEDIRQALQALPPPRVLVTTPVHLRVCVESALSWPSLAYLISATAPLGEGLARAAERCFQAPVREIYGCTEAGSLASRRLVDGPDWQLYDEMRLDQVGEQSWARGPQLPEPVLLGDMLELYSTTRFRLLGRHTDMVNVAGKRASLSDLNQRLNGIPGILDGLFIVPQPGQGPVERLAALVVAPGQDKQRILAALRAQLDPVFLPRPLHLVDSLPRNDTGKLPRQALEALLKTLDP